jgi:hypothetical protein
MLTCVCYVSRVVGLLGDAELLPWQWYSVRHGPAAGKCRHNMSLLRAVVWLQKEAAPAPGLFGLWSSNSLIPSSWSSVFGGLAAAAPSTSSTSTS